MPPQLASLVFVAFIFWLFRRYAKESEPVSAALWIPFFWVGIKASRPLIYWLATGTAASGAAATEGESIDRNVDLLLAVMATVVLARRGIDWAVVKGKCWWLIIFYAYLLLSTVWSEIPFVAFKRWFRDVTDVLMVLVILTDKSPVQAFRWVFLHCIYVLIPVSVLFIKYYPELGRYYSKWTWATNYCGVTSGKNQLGQLAMWSGLLLLWQIVDMHRRNDRWRSWATVKALWPEFLLVGSSFWLLNMAGSATALASAILGTAIFFGSRLRIVRARMKSAALCLAGAAAIMIAITIMPSFRGAIAGSLDRRADLTERTEIWKWALGLHTDPVIGSGFASTFLVPKIRKEAEEIGLPHVHNGYLQTYVDTGMIGVCLLLGVLYAAGRNALWQLSERAIVGHIFAALFFGSLFYNYSEVAWNRSATLGLLVWIMAAYGVVPDEASSPTETATQIATEHLADPKRAEYRQKPTEEIA